MIPMRMGDEQREIERLAFELLQQGLTEQTETRAGIENDDFIPTTDFNTGSIAAVADGTRARSRDGSAYPPKLDGGGSSDGETIPQPSGKGKLKVRRRCINICAAEGSIRELRGKRRDSPTAAGSS
jgi:hypothetical protein